MVGVVELFGRLLGDRERGRGGGQEAAAAGMRESHPAILIHPIPDPSIPDP